MIARQDVPVRTRPVRPPEGTILEPISAVVTKASLVILELSALRHRVP